MKHKALWPSQAIALPGSCRQPVPVGRRSLLNANENRAARLNARERRIERLRLESAAMVGEDRLEVREHGEKGAKGMKGGQCGRVITAVAGFFVLASMADPKGMDGTNEHFLVVPTPKRTFLAVWTQASKENNPDQHLMLSRSEDQGKTWSRPTVLAGDPTGKSGRLA